MLDAAVWLMLRIVVILALGALALGIIAITILTVANVISQWKEKKDE